MSFLNVRLMAFIRSLTFPIGISSMVKKIKSIGIEEVAKKKQEYNYNYCFVLQ